MSNNIIKNKNSTNLRFQVRDSENELEMLDDALIKLGYTFKGGKADRAGWYREMKRIAIKEAKKVIEITEK